MGKQKIERQILPILFWVLHLSLLAILFMPFPSISFPIPNADKGVHILLFIAVSIITFRYLGGKLWPMALGLSFYAFLIEVGQQLFTTTRSFDLADWAAGTLGILIGMGIVALFINNKK